MTLPETIIVQVTQHHINAGVANNCKRCPIALAVWDAWPATHPFVAHVCFSLDVDNLSQENTYRLPKKAQDFIRMFDSGAPVQPFTFMATKATQINPQLFFAEGE